MWFLINLSKEYKTEITFNVQYDKLSQEKIFKETPIEEITLLVQGNGFNLFSANVSNKKLVLSLNKLKRKRDTLYYLLPNTQKSALQNQLKSGLELVDILQDTIHFNLGTLSVKKVPVRFTNAIKFKPGYGLAATELKPDSILVSGPASEISKISSLSTETLNIQDVSEDIQTDIAIQLPNDGKGIKLSNNSVEAKILVDKFTEGTFEIPVKLINISKKLDVNIFPKKVKVTFKVGLKNYSKITEDSFEVLCDYKAAKEKGVMYLTPIVKSRSNLVSSVRVSPQKIDFLIHK
ncbi:CdaR family protein [Tenacibaculum amylolyticum]|uniref:CdaR family protein n=1 Tax=Tenacibaculum amylolyticum TaxID=104269 RepID=UPI003893CBB0